MPGLPLVARETTFSRSRTGDQMCRQNFFNNLSPEEALAAEESLSVYCKPVELYNILLRRASYNPLFLQRCLSYKKQASRKHRIRITVSVSANMDDEFPSQSVSPLYIFLARPITESSQAEGTTAYRLSRVCNLDSSNQREASFVVPEFSKLIDDFRYRSLTLILLGHGEESCEQAAAADGNEKLVGNYIWGKLLLQSILSSDMHVNLKLGQRIEVPSTITTHPCTLEPTFLDANTLIHFQTPHTCGTENTANQVKLSISARQVGLSDRSPYESCLYDDVPANVIRLRVGNVIFNYKYYNNSLQKTEVTEDFSCPFCLVKCASFKGLRYHLTSSHDLFNFEFWVTEEYQAVNVSMRTDLWRSEILAHGIDPRTQTFNYRSRKIRRRRAKISGSSARNVCTLPLASDLPEVPGDSSHAELIGEVRGIGDSMPQKDGCPKSAPHGHLSKFPRSEGEIPGSENASDEHVEHSAACAASAQSSVDEYGQLVSAASASLQLGKAKKTTVDRADPKNRTLLQKRQFFHSHRAQAMALEQVLSDRDSEDEVDNDIADLEDRRMLDDFVDVTKDEKRIMHLWNSFVRRQRVLADGHIPWACEAFTKLHGPDFIKEPALLWCWRLFMIKLWNHSLLDARSMNSCNLLLEKYQNPGPDSTPS